MKKLIAHFLYVIFLIPCQSYTGLGELVNKMLPSIARQQQNIIRKQMIRRCVTMNMSQQDIDTKKKRLADLKNQEWLLNYALLQLPCPYNCPHLSGSVREDILREDLVDVQEEIRYLKDTLARSNR